MKISDFLTERESRIKPAEANKMNLKRLNKIDFSGEIHLLNKPTNTDMILIKKGDLVISGINVEKGAVAVYQGNEDILATIHYSAYIFDKNKIDIEYFKIFLRSALFKEAINSQTKNGIKTEIKPKIFLQLEINLPSLENQIKIKDELQNKIKIIKNCFEIEERNESYISKLRQAILQEEFTSINSKFIKIGEIIKLVNGENIKGRKLPYLEARYIRGKKEAQIFNEGELVRKGELVILMDGENSGEIFELQEDGYLGSTFKILKYENLIDKKYLQYFILLNKERYKNSKKGIAIPHLDKTLFKETLLPLPPLSEQKRIVEKVDKLIAYCDELEKQVKENQKNAEKLMEAVLRESFEK